MHHFLPIVILFFSIHLLLSQHLLILLGRDRVAHLIQILLLPIILPGSHHLLRMSILLLLLIELLLVGLLLFRRHLAEINLHSWRTAIHHHLLLHLLLLVLQLLHLLDLLLSHLCHLVRVHLHLHHLLHSRIIWIHHHLLLLVPLHLLLGHLLVSINALNTSLLTASHALARSTRLLRHNLLLRLARLHLLTQVCTLLGRRILALRWPSALYSLRRRLLLLLLFAVHYKWFKLNY